LCAKKLLCLLCLVLCLNVASYKAGAETVGFTDVFGGSTTASTRRAMPFDMSEDGTIESVSMYHQAGNPDMDMILAVYDDNSNSPGSRIAITAETSISDSEDWQTITLITPVDVDFGEKIWLAWLYESNPGIHWRTGSPSRADSGEGWSGGMPAEFGTVSIGSTQYSIYATYTPGPPDTDPPTPTTSTWDSEPAATGPFSISMTATEATDPSGVQYYFENETEGGHDSGWQTGRIYNDLGLTPETEYTYRVKTRDQSPNHNEGNWSVSRSATTDELPSAECPPGDLDGNCIVEFDDLLIFVEQWLDPCGCPGHPEDCADLDEQDDGIDLDDYAVLAANWLEYGVIIGIGINEFMADNETTIEDEDEPGEYPDWIEIYNAGPIPVDMGGMYVKTLDDSYQILPGVSIAPGEYKLFWADKEPEQGPLHLDIKIDKDGDKITLYQDDEVTVIDSKSFNSMAEDVSLGRYPDGQLWYDMGDPTPGLPNTLPMAGEVYFSHPGGTFTTTFSLGLTTKSPTATIRYTTDGSEPDDLDTLYTSPFTVSSTTWVRARAYESGLEPGLIVSKNYIALDPDVQTFTSNLPIVVIDSFGFDIDSEWEPWTYL